MNKLIQKELRLSTSPLTYCFLAFSFMTLIPGYPILIGSFFLCFGIFQSFQLAREANDILYAALLPIKKSDVVKTKFLITIFFQTIGFVLMAGLTVLRMTVMSDSGPYVTNPLMNANFVFLGFVFLVFAAFNGIFLRGFFRTAYYYGKPFIWFIVVALLLVGVAETLHHLPGLSALNAGFGPQFGPQIYVFATCMALYILITALSLRNSKRSFERIDL